jgi:hypothetical protein
MASRKKACNYLIGLLLLLASQFGLAACGSSNPTPKPTLDVSVIARQTVSAIYTQTAVAVPTESQSIPAVESTATPEPQMTAVENGPTPAGQTPSPAVETPGGVPQEPTRNVVMETPNGSVPQETYHEPTVEGTASK